MSLRQQRHLEQCPGDIYLMPVYVIFSTLFLLPIRLYGFLRMAKPAGWGTRANAYAGGDVGTPASVAGVPLHSWTADESAGAGAVAVATRPAPAVAAGTASRARRNPYEIVPCHLVRASRRGRSAL